MTDETTLRKLAANVLDAWNTQEVERVLAVYTPDVVYRDPNTRGAIEGANGMGRYLAKLFANWQMHWTLRDVFPFAGKEGGSFLWHATFRRPNGTVTVAADGMDLILLRGTLLARNDVYFDRTILAPLM